MLLKVAGHICECLARAEQAREQAQATTNPRLKADYLDIELRWLRLADSYRFVEQVDRFLTDAQQKRDSATDSPAGNASQNEKPNEKINKRDAPVG